MVLATNHYENMRVLTWNLSLLPSFASNVSRPAKDRIADIVDIIKKEYWDCDVLMFNEVFVHKDLLQEALKEDYPYQHALGGKWYKWFGSGLVTVSKLPFTDIHGHIYHAWAGWDTFTAKGFLDTMMSYDTDRIHFINTHMQQGTSSCDNRSRDKQIRELVAYVKGLPSTDVVLVGGDLNMAPNDDRSQSYHDLVNGSGLSEPCYMFNGSDNNLVRFLHQNLGPAYASRRRSDWTVSDTRAKTITFA